MILTKDGWGDASARGWCAFNKPDCSESWSVQYMAGYDDLPSLPKSATVGISFNGRSTVDFDEHGLKSLMEAIKEGLDMMIEYNKQHKQKG